MVANIRELFEVRCLRFEVLEKKVKIRASAQPQTSDLKHQTNFYLRALNKPTNDTPENDSRNYSRGRICA